MNSLQTVLRKAGSESAGVAPGSGRERSPEEREQAGIPRFLAHPALQAKLEVGPEDDPLEREADAIAESVLHDASALPRFLSPADGDRGRAAAPTNSGAAVRPQGQPGVRRKSLRADPPDDGQGEASADRGDSVQPLLPSLRTRIEATLGADLADVRVHQGATAADANARLGARAFTHGRDVWLGERQRPDDTALMAHEAAHVVQQGRGDTAIRREPDPAAGAGSTPAVAAGQSFAFSEDEMASRLAATPAAGADAAAPSVDLNPGTRSTLTEVADEGQRGEGEPVPEEEAAAETVEAGGGEEGAAGAGGEDAGDGGHGDGALRAGGSTPDEGLRRPVERPGPAAEFESLVGEEVAAYLEGNLSDERIAALDPRTRALLDATDALGDRRLTDPEASALQGLAGEGLQPGAPRTGYEAEPLWLRTLATIRDVTGQLGGIVGIIGLVATVSGFILSLLLPPVGAFLLTVGRFCDVAALILDGISLVLGIVLTGYNYYRLKNETDPEERRRLLGMVRQDAMGTVMSAVAVATAVAPGAARLLGRAGQRVSRTVRTLSRSGGMLGRGARALRVAGASGRLAMRAARRGLRATGRAVSSGFQRLSRSSSLLGRAARGVRVAGVSSRLALRSTGRAARARASQALGWARGTASVRWANRLGGQAEELARGRLRGLAQGDSMIGRFYNRRLRGFHERNVMLARSIGDPVERAYQLRLGQELRGELDRLRQANPTWSASQLDDALRARFGRERYGHAEVGTSDAGNLQFVRDDAAFLRQVRETEFTEIQLIRDRLPPGASPRELADAVNQSPFIKGSWTEDELRAFMNLNPTRRPDGGLALRDAAGEALAVSKTGHHTIPAGMAPQISQDPRFIQIVNDSRSYRDFIDNAYPGMTHVPEVSGYMVPGRRRPLVQAADRRAVIADMLDRGQIPGYTRADIEYFMGRGLADDLVADGSSGVWRNRRVAGRSMFFNPHLGIGHAWNWRTEVARQIFSMDTRLGLSLRRELGEQLLLPMVRRSGRLAVGTPESPGRTVGGAINERAAALIDRSIAARAGSGRSGARGEAASALLDSLRSELETAQAPGGEEVSPAQDTLTQFADSGLAGGAATASEGTEIESAGDAVGGEEPVGDEIKAPPSPVPYSPSALVSIREQRTDLASAMEVVNDYVGETVDAEQHNVAARAAAATLLERNAGQAGFAGTERETVAAEQGKLEQASASQQEMSAQGAEASGDAARGQQEADTVQSEGQGVSVEAKPEEPRSRSWLERAWDATAGALWDGLVAPAIRAVRRKVNQVMQSINEFIMGMINQALGLDEIEAELDGGGQDIEARSGSLDETDAGLEAVGEQASEEKERNRQSMDQAEANIDDSRATREDALALQNDLAAHDGLLEAEEMAGQSYVVDFGATYRPYFAATGEGGEAAQPGEGSASESGGTAEAEESETDETALVA
jgi:hypothetical protein